MQRSVLALNCVWNSRAKRLEPNQIMEILPASHCYSSSQWKFSSWQAWLLWTRSNQLGKEWLFTESSLCCRLSPNRHKLTEKLTAFLNFTFHASSTRTSILTTYWAVCSSSRMGTHLQPGQTTPPAECSTYARTKSWVYTGGQCHCHCHCHCHCNSYFHCDHWSLWSLTSDPTHAKQIELNKKCKYSVHKIVLVGGEEILWNSHAAVIPEVL